MTKFFCRKCGAACNVKEKAEWFDNHTGKPSIIYVVTCPNSTYLNSFFPWAGHYRNTELYVDGREIVRWGGQDC